MKKLLSLVIAVVMVASMMVLAFPASATATHTLDANNVGIDVPYFDGTTIYHQVSGKISDLKTIESEEIDQINYTAKDGDGELNLDGVITAAEWGTPLLNLSSEYAATLGGDKPSAENTFHWHTPQLKNGDNQLYYPNSYNPDTPYTYKVWMAWDEDFLYIAAEVNDPDKFYLGNDGGANIWDGDALQFIIDPDGPNSVANGSGYTPYPGTENTYLQKGSRPWASYAENWVNGDDVIRGKKYANIGAAYTGGDSGHPEVYDMSDRYFDHYGDELDSLGAPTGRQVAYWNQSDIMYGNVTAENPNVLLGNKRAFAAVKPTGTMTYVTVNGQSTRVEVFKTTYELAIPWELVDGSYYEYDKTTGEATLVAGDRVAEAGAEYGLSIVALNATTGASSYENSHCNQWLTWGSGICGAQENGATFPTAGGSNSMVLVSDKLGTTGCNHTFSNPTCENPYICTKCGYE
ncbi:MAG: hypothetical protein IKN38_06815, partial [Clostridia bacterium]|nr:hypothetical protein [Clostridia bacterium]